MEWLIWECNRTYMCGSIIRFVESMRDTADNRQRDDRGDTTGSSTSLDFIIISYLPDYYCTTAHKLARSMLVIMSRKRHSHQERIRKKIETAGVIRWFTLWRGCVVNCTIYVINRHLGQREKSVF